MLRKLKSRKPRRTDVVMSAQRFFKLLKESAWDLPSAWYEYCRLIRLRNPRELPMHARDLDDGDIAQIRSVFGRRIPPELIADDWDT